MQSSTRTAQALSECLSKISSTPYVCRSCRHHAFRQRIANQQQLRCASSSNLPFTERLRRKIWGTDNPPGLADPYGGPSFLERKLQQRKEAEEHGNHASVEEGNRSKDPIDSAQANAEVTVRLPGRDELEEYVPAETWDGL